MLPLIKTELVKTSWLKESFQVCYFLVKDFTVLRVPSKIISKIMANDSKFKQFNGAYLKKLNETLYAFRETFLSGKTAQQNEARLCLKVRSTLKTMELLFELAKGPQTLDSLSELEEFDDLKDLIEKGFVMELNIKGTPYYILLTEIKIKKFTPKYLVNAVATKLENEEITNEIALKHLELLYDSEVSWE